MRKHYSQAQLKRTHEITEVIGDSNSLLILFELMNFGDKSFNEIKRMTEINSVTLSKKLNTLKDQKYVDLRVVGNEHHYFIRKKTESLRPIIKEIEALVLSK